MKVKISFIALLMAVSTFITAQCSINELRVEATECNVSGEFFVFINFNHIGTSDQFKILGNGKNYGTFKYDSIPVKIGPLKADCHTNYEFVVQDFENTNCSAFKNFGTKCCNDECSLKFYDATASDCVDGKYTLKFNLHHVAPDNGFDLYNNGVHYGYYQYNQLPLTLKEFPSDLHETTNKIVACANDNPHCCDTILLSNPCLCNISKIKGQVIDCNEADSTFSIKFTFKHQLTADSFRVGGNNHNYGTFAYSDLPITIKNLKFSDLTDYEFLFVDKNDPFCFGSYALGFVTNCHFPCTIDDVQAFVTECNDDGKFYVNLFFKEKNTSIAGFEVRGNGKIYGSYEYGETSYKIGPLAGDCKTIYEFVVKDKELLDCSAFTALSKPVCCDSICHLGELTIHEVCVDSLLKGFELNFGHSNTSKTFILKINDKILGTYNYADLPLKITDLSFGLPKVTITIKDAEKGDCILIKEYLFSCSPAPYPCKLYDMVVTATDCNDKGEFYAKVKFLSNNPGSGGFVIKVNGVVFDTLPYGKDVYEVGPLKGDCSTIYKFFMYDLFHPDCTEEYGFTEKICCNTKECSITDMIVKAGPCNDHGEFYAILKFGISNPGNQGFIVRVNGVNFDTLQYGQALYEIGPLKGDCATLYKFLILDRQFECREDYGFTEKICCENAACSIKEPLLTFLPCVDNKFGIQINFGHTGNSPQFRVKVNGVLIGTYNYADLPVTIPGFKPKQQHEIVIWDVENEACRLVFTIPGIECTSATEEILASGINIGVSQDKINIDATKSGIIDRLFIYDIQGRQILVARPMAQEFSVPIDQFIAGVYVIRIQLGSIFVNKKIVIP